MEHPGSRTGCTAEVALTGPLDLGASLEWLRRWGDDLIDRWDGTVLVRPLEVSTGVAGYAATPGGDSEHPRVTVVVDDASHLGAACAAVETMVVSAPGPLADLRERDPVIDRLEARHPGLRPVRQPDLLAALVRAISAQQVNLRWAATTRRRLAEAFGTEVAVGPHRLRVLEARHLAGVDPQALRDLQFTTAKARAIVGAAEAVASGRLDPAEVAGLPDDEVIARLSALRGVGRWTAEWILARTLGRPRVVAGDLGVRKAVGRAYAGGAMPAEEEVRSLTAHWGAAAAVAQALLLHALAEGTLEG